MVKTRYKNDKERIDDMLDILIGIYCELNNGVEDQKLSIIKKYFTTEDRDANVKIWLESLRMLVNQGIEVAIERNPELMTGTVPVTLTTDLIKNILKIQKS